MKREDIVKAIQSNRLEEVQRASLVLREDPNMMLRDRGTWTVTPLFLAVDQPCNTAEEREHNFAIVSYLLCIPGIKASIHREEDNFSCLAAAVYQGKVAVISKLLTHLRYVELKGDRGAFLEELNNKIAAWQVGGGTALSWAINRQEPSIARLLLAVDPDNIDISDEDIDKAETNEQNLDYLVGDLKRARKKQQKRKLAKQRILEDYNKSKNSFNNYNLWSERATQFLAFTTGALSLLGVFFSGIPIEPAQVVLAAFISVITWYLSNVKKSAEDSRNKAVFSLITENGFFDEPNEIDKAVERQFDKNGRIEKIHITQEETLSRLRQDAAARGYELRPIEPDS